MNLVNVLKSAAHRYGTERRVLLLHGPVGSSKSTIARLLKKGLETLLEDRRRGACTPTVGARRGSTGPTPYVDCPMHEEPLHLVPNEFRAGLVDSPDDRGGRPPLPDHHRGRPLPVLPSDV